jgi:SET domain-containing protein
MLTLNSNECVDASRKGNLARFINHSCNPNAVTQKWSVQGELRVGIFAARDISNGEEITFDYQFERIGSKKQAYVIHLSLSLSLSLSLGVCVRAKRLNKS